MSRIRPARQHRRARTSAPSPKLGFLQMIRHRMDIKRTLFLSLVLLAASLFVGELAAFAGFKFYATERLARHWRVDPSAAVASLTPVSIQRYQKQFFDPVLGWSFHEETTAFPYAAFDATGARVDSVDGPTGRIAAYGDSFTFGEGAGYDETWPH